MRQQVFLNESFVEVKSLRDLQKIQGSFEQQVLRVLHEHRLWQMLGSQEGRLQGLRGVVSMRDGTIIDQIEKVQAQMEHNILILSTQLEHMNNRLAAIQEVAFSRFAFLAMALAIFWPGGVQRILMWRERVIAKQMFEYAQQVKARHDKARAERLAKIQVVKPHQTHGLVKP